MGPGGSEKNRGQQKGNVRLFQTKKTGAQRGPGYTPLPPPSGRGLPSFKKSLPGAKT